MASSSTCATFLVALKTALAARFAAHGTLSAVRVDLVPTGDTSAIDAVTLIHGPITGNQEYATFGNRRQDTYTIPGLIDTYGTGPDSDIAFQDAWDKGSLIVDELILQLRDTPPLSGSDMLVKGRVADINYHALVRDNGGWICRCEYTLTYGTVVS